MIAFAVGWLIYMVAMLLTVYDGLLSMIFQPIAATFWSGLFVLFALAAGVALRIPALKRLWQSLGLLVLLIPVASILVMIFATDLGLTYTALDPDLDVEVQVMSPLGVAALYFSSLFPIVHLPLRLPSLE